MPSPDRPAHRHGSGRGSARSRCRRSAHMLGCLVGGQRPRLEPWAVGCLGRGSAGSERTPVVPINVPGQEGTSGGPTRRAARVRQFAWSACLVVDVIEAQSFTGPDRTRDRRLVLRGRRLTPPGRATVAARIVSMRSRSREGSICSSLTSARSDASSMPVTPAPVVVRRPTATAAASSSSSSSGGMVVPCPGDIRLPRGVASTG